MSHPARLSLRAPPHLPFIQGWPGIPSSTDRKQPAIHGTVEVRIGPHPIKARWVRVEIRKHESLPPGFPSSSSHTEAETWDHVGEIGTLWSAAAGKEWDNLEQADYKFYLPLPVDVPPSVEMAKGNGVRYELVAALCYRQKGGLFKKESASIIKITEPLRITKHEMHSAWPLYNQPDSRTVSTADHQINLTVQRPSSAFGPTDRILFTATIKSARPQSFKLKGFDCQLLEIITNIPAAAPASTKSRKSKPTPAPISRSRPIASTRYAIDDVVVLGREKSARMEIAVPGDRLSMTVEAARTLEVRYELEVKAVCDGLPELRAGGIRYIVGPFSRPHAQQAVK